MDILVFATNNEHKVQEVAALAPAGLKILSLKEAGVEIDIAEPHATLQENAAEKAGVIWELLGRDCFSEDTGLEVKALGGQPGVKTARYAGDEATATDNMQKLLSAMKDQKNRAARFRTVMCLIAGGKQYFFEGICEGEIATEMIGENGFGYDPVFIPQGFTKTMAELNREEKSAISHRQKALSKLLEWINMNYGKG